MNLGKKLKHMPNVVLPATEAEAAEQKATPAPEPEAEPGKKDAKAKMSQFLGNKGQKGGGAFGQASTGKVGSKAKSHYRPKI